jgi:hypothetical protein
MQNISTSLNDILEFNPDSNSIRFKFRPIEHFNTAAERNRWNYRYGGMILDCLPGSDLPNTNIF